MSRCIALMVLVFTFALPSVGFAGWAESVGAVDTKVELIRKGRDQKFNATLKQKVKKICEEGRCGGKSYEELTKRMLGDQEFLINLMNKLKSQLGTATTSADLNTKIEKWIEDACKVGGLIRVKLQDWVDGRAEAKANEVFDARKAEIVPETPTVRSAMQLAMGVNGQFLLREQGYFPLLVGLRAVVGEGSDIEIALLFGPGQDWERDAHMDFVFGGRGVASLEMVENFNFRLGLAGVVKLATRDGNTRSGDVAITAGLELEFASWIYFVVDVGPTWSLREDTAGLGLYVNAGPVSRIF